MGQENGRLRRFGEISVLSLRGSGYDMGFQHGSLLRDEVRSGVVPRFGDYVESDAQMRRQSPEAKRGIREYLDREVYRPLESFIPQTYRDELRGIADGAGLSYELVLRGNLLSELGQVSAKRLAAGATGQEAAGGCTGFVVADADADGGKLIQAKNTDYSGAGLWDRFLTLVFQHPDDGYSYVRGSSAGLIKCNTCMNEHGIAMGGHFLFSYDAEPDGLGMTALENQVMREASTLEEAVRIIEEQPRAGSFAFIVSDAKTREAVVLECTRSSVGKRWRGEGPLFMTNTACADPDMKEKDILLANGVGRNPLSRFERIGQLFAERQEPLDVQAAIDLLGDHYDPASGRTRAVAHTIASLATVTSVVLSPEDRQIWLGMGPAPVSNNPFLGFDCSPEFEGRGPADWLGRLDGNGFAKDPRLEGLRLYRQASAAYDRDPEAVSPVIALLEGALEIDPEEPSYARMLARFELRRSGFAAARQALERALAVEAQGPSERAEAHLLLGHAHDLEERREAAMEQYRAALALRDDQTSAILAVNPLVLHAAEKHLDRPFAPGDVGATTISFTLLSGWE